MKSKSLQKGFTLIELVMVIVILGVLAAVAIPKFTNLSAEANTAAVQSIAGSLGAASATNYAVRSAKSTNGSAVTDCTSVIGLLLGGALPTNGGGTYAVTAAPVAVNVTIPCTLTFTPTNGSAATTSNFNATGIL